MQKTCQRCEEAELRRVNRRGFLEKIVLPYFGVYPWECVFCRKKMLLHDDGHAKMRDQSIGSASLAASAGKRPSKPV
jgi:hypothetical protein